MISYQTLTQADLVELARQRVRELEIEHYRLRLRCADAQSQQEGVELAAQLADIEARHSVHVPAPAQDEADTSDSTEAADAEPSTELVASNGHHAE